jgi:hypothetical protein
MDRRGFLRAAGRRRRILEVSCERLYMQYLEARAGGRLDQFARTLARDVAAAHEVRLMDREWLAREDFRDALGPLLTGPGAHRPRPM